MRRVVWITAFLVSLSQPLAAATLDRVRETHVFKIGYRADAKPYSYRTPQGNAAGYIVDLCREVAAAVAHQIGGAIKTEYILVHADKRFEAVRDGQVDVLCDPASITMARREIVDFSLPIFLDGAAILSRSSDPIDSYRDLNGKRVGVLTGTTTERTLREALAALKVKATIETVTDHRIGMDLLASDKIDAYFADRAIIAALLYEGGRPGFRLTKQYFSYEIYGLALRRGDDGFRLLVDRTLARIYRSGRIEGILAKTFGKTPADEILKAMFIINGLPE